MRKSLVLVSFLAFACSKKPSEGTPVTQTAPTAEAAPGAAPNALTQTFVTTVSGARIRVTATADGTEVVRLPIGAKLESDATEGEWHRVTTADGAKGYIAASVTKHLDKDTYLKVFTDRLAADKLTFPDYADLYGAVKRVEEETQDHAKKAEFELLRQRTLKKTLAAGEQEQPPYKGFINQYSADVVYSEPGGEWLPHFDPTWKAAEAYMDTPSGEAIAWEAATTYLPGECEGFFGCAVDVTNTTWGHYLRLFPKGPHAAEALEHYAQLEPPSKLNEIGDYDGETWQELDDNMKVAASSIAQCDPEARKGAEAMIATEKRNQSFLFRGKNVPAQKKK